MKNAPVIPYIEMRRGVVLDLSRNPLYPDNIHTQIHYPIVSKPPEERDDTCYYCRNITHRLYLYLNYSQSAWPTYHKDCDMSDIYLSKLLKITVDYWTDAIELHNTIYNIAQHKDAKRNIFA